MQFICIIFIGTATIYVYIFIAKQCKIMQISPHLNEKLWVAPERLSQKDE